MKVAILSESEVDEAFIEIIISVILAESMERINRSFKSEGFQKALNVLPSMIRDLYYQTDAEAFAVVVDSDETVIHNQSHETNNTANTLSETANCRLCQIKKVIEQTQQKISIREERPMIKVAVGLAVPAIEAWYQYGIDAQASEAAWLVASKERRYSHIKQQLKKAVYKVDRPSIPLMTKCAIEAANRLANGLSDIETLFPGGFGSFAQDIRGWKNS
ncbi:MAG: hypothetical protein WAQ98_24190 [Blastocatellia bacterium]